jgi:hypothetical protein
MNGMGHSIFSLLELAYVSPAAKVILKVEDP